MDLSEPTLLKIVSHLFHEEEVEVFSQTLCLCDIHFDELLDFFLASRPYTLYKVILAITEEREGYQHSKLLCKLLGSLLTDKVFKVKFTTSETARY